jgi:hypothetical protein
VRTFVFTVENFLVQSQAARHEIKHAIGAALACTITPRRAAVRLDQVQRNRQSLLDQLAALRVPAGEDAGRAADLLQKATHASIEADWVYRDWLRQKKTCRNATPPPRVARARDARATAYKRSFVAAFDPLAKEFHQRVWQADEF